MMDMERLMLMEMAMGEGKDLGVEMGKAMVTKRDGETDLEMVKGTDMEEAQEKGVVMVKRMAT